MANEEFSLIGAAFSVLLVFAGAVSVAAFILLLLGI